MTKLVANVDPDVQLEITDVLRVMGGDVVSLSKSSLDSIVSAHSSSFFLYIFKMHVNIWTWNWKTKKSIYGVNTGFGQLAKQKIVSQSYKQSKYKEEIKRICDQTCS